MRTLYRERRWYCGDYLEVAIYPVHRQAGGRRGKAKPTSETMERLNLLNRQKELVRLLNANFTGQDLELHLTYRDECLPTDKDGAARELRNFLRRLKRLYEKRGVTLRYIYVTEGGDGKRFHHHVTLSGGVSRDDIEALWWLGYANSRRLQLNENGVEGLAKYITKQMKEEQEKGKRAYSCSKNLIHPEPIDRDGRFSRKTVKAMADKPKDGTDVLEAIYDGYEVSDFKPFHNDLNGGYYLYARLYRKDAAFLSRKRQRRKGGAG
ncbi:MAG: hypothetical protein IJD10_07745 [Clostridia bacterium]|nr:hypothetical protein [Clostridia bacterium]